MSRLSLPRRPAVLLLAACGSPNDGTSQSESATVPAGEGAMTAPDMSSDTDNNNAGTTTGPAADGSMSGDRKSVVEGKRVSVRVALGGRRIIKKENNSKKALTHRN